MNHAGQAVSDDADSLRGEYDEGKEGDGGKGDEEGEAGTADGEIGGGPEAAANSRSLSALNCFVAPSRLSGKQYPLEHPRSRYLENNGRAPVVDPARRLSAVR